MNKRIRLKVYQHDGVGAECEETLLKGKMSLSSGCLLVSTTKKSSIPHTPWS